MDQQTQEARVSGDGFDFVIVVLTTGEYSDFRLGDVIRVPRHEWEASAARMREANKALHARKDQPLEHRRAQREFEATKLEEALRLSKLALGGIDAHELWYAEPRYWDDDGKRIADPPDCPRQQDLDAWWSGQ